MYHTKHPYQTYMLRKKYEENTIQLSRGLHKKKKKKNTMTNFSVAPRVWLNVTASSRTLYSCPAPAPLSPPSCGRTISAMHDMSTPPPFPSCQNERVHERNRSPLLRGNKNAQHDNDANVTTFCFSAKRKGESGDAMPELRRYISEYASIHIPTCTDTYRNTHRYPPTCVDVYKKNRRRSFTHVDIPEHAPPYIKRIDIGYREHASGNSDDTSRYPVYTRRPSRRTHRHLP